MNSVYKYPLPPQNYISEEILLGIILIYPSTFPHIIPFIQSEYFFLECHQIIYKHLIKIHKNHKLNSIEMYQYLSDNYMLHYIGGIDKITNIIKQGQIFLSYNKTNVYIQELIEIIKFNYIKRLIIQYGQNIVQLAYIKNISTYKLYNKASYYLHITEKKIPKNQLKSFEKLIGNFLLSKNKLNFTDTNIPKLFNTNFKKSGFINLDKLISGLPNGELIVIAGRPSMGKTSLAINLACNVLNTHKIGICFFSLEMSSEQIINKLLATYTKIPIKEISLKILNKNKWKNINTICRKLLQNYIYINDIPNVSIDYIEYTSKLLKQEYSHINLIIIDYLQLIQTDIESINNRVQELSYITRKLKLLAQYLNIPLIILSQLNRNIETRNNKKPLLSDLKESGCINYTEKILIKIKQAINYIFIQKMAKKYNIFLRLDQIYNKNILKYNKYINKILLFAQYIFELNILQSTKLFITYNHKYISYKQWQYNHQIVEKYPCNLTNKYNEICKTQKIQFLNYSIVYDLHITQYFHLISNNIILHNSIEQDADIIMMLYDEISTKIQQKNQKIIDISIIKNRNGPIGSFKLQFYPDNNLFIDHEEK
uniref:DNA 5'-3' helicase n=1 Tax=Anotrichium furcellatum TaxID=41999 RepID=A0A4D6WNR0_9FLOR|nr:replication helicase subunit [Anotrichium furcellatum]